MFTETRSRIEDNIWGAKGFSDKEASVVHAVLNSVRKAAGDLEEKNKEESQVASKMTREIENTALPIADLELKFPDIGLLQTNHR